MELHTLHEIVSLEVRSDVPSLPGGLSNLLADLSFVKRTDAPRSDGALVLDVHQIAGGPSTCPSHARMVGQVDDLQVFQHADELFVTDGASTLHVEPGHGRATARLADSFDGRPSLHRQRFWTAGLLRLLARRGFHALHAAGVVTPDGIPLLLIGPSGCGKSTLTIGLVRAGGRFLSDDALLLAERADGVSALALRKPFSVDATRAGEYRELLSTERPAEASTGKRRVEMSAAYPEQRLERFTPRVILLPSIADVDVSELRPVARSEALGAVLAQGGHLALDRDTARSQLSACTALLRQVAVYRLAAGRDLFTNPSRLSGLLERAGGA